MLTFSMSTFFNGEATPSSPMFVKAIDVQDAYDKWYAEWLCYGDTSQTLTEITEHGENSYVSFIQPTEKNEIIKIVAEVVENENIVQTYIVAEKDGVTLKINKLTGRMIAKNSTVTPATYHIVKPSFDTSGEDLKVGAVIMNVDNKASFSQKDLEKMYNQ